MAAVASGSSPPPPAPPNVSLGPEVEVVTEVRGRCCCLETAGAFSPWLPDRSPNGIRVTEREEPKMDPGEVEGGLVPEAFLPGWETRFPRCEASLWVLGLEAGCRPRPVRGDASRSSPFGTAIHRQTEAHQERAPNSTSADFLD